MNQENYRILEVDASATDEEVKASYERLKEKYNEEKRSEEHTSELQSQR